MKAANPSSRPTAMWISAIVLVVVALHWTQVLAVPIAFAVFLIALVWPLHRRLLALTHPGVALVVSVMLPLLVMAAFLLATGYGINAITKGLAPYTEHMQELYGSFEGWLEREGIVPSLPISEMGPDWVFGLLQGAANRANSIAGFLTFTLIFLILGLLEVADTRRRLPYALGERTATQLTEAFEETAWKFRRYMLVRTIISALTGVLTWLFALVMGLELAGVWGGLAFLLNYIPFIGPIIAVIPPVIFAFAQFEPWLMPLLVLAGMTLIQFSLGNLLEPRLEGHHLSISPFIVVVSVFFWGLVWGIPGAFIGVPLTIAILTVFDRFPETRWISRLMTPRPEHGKLSVRDDKTKHDSREL